MNARITVQRRLVPLTPTEADGNVGVGTIVIEDVKKIPFLTVFPHNDSTAVAMIAFVSYVASDAEEAEALAPLVEAAEAWIEQLGVDTEDD